MMKMLLDRFKRMLGHDEPPMEAEIKRWLDWLDVDHSKQTTRSYAWELNALVKVIPKPTPSAYTMDDLTAYIAHRRAHYGENGNKRGEELSANAVKRTVWAFKSFFGFTLKDKSPAIDLPNPKVKRREQRTLTEAQALAVLAACEANRPTGARDLAAICLMLDSGWRVGEVCRLRLDKLNMAELTAHVITKGGDEEVGTFSPETANIINMWLGYREKIAKPGVPTLFVSTGGLTKGRPLTTDGLRRAFGYLVKRGGLAHFSPHDLRRSFATLAIQFGAPTKIVQVAGRWENIDQVEGYTKAIRQRDFTQYMPVHRLLKG
jgi:site-specific recombinase XerD